MLQRVQSIFLSLAVLLTLTLFLLPLTTVEVENQSFELLLYELSYFEGSKNLIQISLLIITIIEILIVSFSIFKYNNRLIQIKIIQFAFFVNLIIITGISLVIDNFRNDLSNLYNQITNRPNILIIVSIIICQVLYYLALRYIKKDEALIRSIDRVR